MFGTSRSLSMVASTGYRNGEPRVTTAGAKLATLAARNAYANGGQVEAPHLQGPVEEAQRNRLVGLSLRAAAEEELRRERGRECQGMLPE